MIYQYGYLLGRYHFLNYLIYWYFILRFEDLFLKFSAFILCLNHYMHQVQLQYTNWGYHKQKKTFFSLQMIHLNDAFSLNQIIIFHMLTLILQYLARKCILSILIPLFLLHIIIVLPFYHLQQVYQRVSLFLMIFFHSENLFYFLYCCLNFHFSPLILFETSFNSSQMRLSFQHLNHSSFSLIIFPLRLYQLKEGLILIFLHKCSHYI